MSDDKKNISIEVRMPTAATALEQSAPDKAEPIVTDPVPVEKTVPADKAEPAVPEYPSSDTPEQPKPEKKAQQTATLDKDDPAPVHSGKVVDFATARGEAAKEEKKAVKQKPPTEKDKPAKPGRGRPPKDGKAAQTSGQKVPK